MIMYSLRCLREKRRDGAPYRKHRSIGSFLFIGLLGTVTGAPACAPNHSPPDCSTCSPDYYGANCTTYCAPAPGRYSCNNATGEKECLDNWDGDDCAVCLPDYFGKECNTFCQDHPFRYKCDRNSGSTNCSQYWHNRESHCRTYCFPHPSHCAVRCDINVYLTCSHNGTKICRTNRVGKNCVECAEYYHGRRCDRFCKPGNRNYSCTEDGMKICYGNRGGENCSTCKQDFYGVNCTTHCVPAPGPYSSCNPATGQKECLNNWDGENCTVCISDYFGKECSTFCKDHPFRYTCDESGSKICSDNWFDPECTTFCKPDAVHYECSVDGYKICLGNFAGEQCEEEVLDTPDRNIGYIVGGVVVCGIVLGLAIFVIIWKRIGRNNGGTTANTMTSISNTEMAEDEDHSDKALELVNVPLVTQVSYLECEPSPYRSTG